VRSLSSHAKPQYADKTWAVLRDAICQINRRDASGLSFEELYRNAYNMVLHRHGDKLYRGLVEVTKEHLAGVASDVDAARGDTFAVTLEKKWREHQKSMSMIRDILMYMDRIYAPPNALEPVYDLGLSLWRDVVLRDEAINARVRDFLLSAIDAERRGERVDAGAVRAMTRMLMDVGEDVYVHDFETHLLRATAAFYRSESETLLGSCDCYAYLRRAEARLEEEHARVGAYLCARTEAFLVRRAEQELLERPTRRVLGLPNSGLRAMLAESRVEQAALAYKLYARVEGGLAFVKGVFADHALEEGKKLVNDPDLNADPARYVESLLSLKRRLDATAAEAFRADRGFVDATRAAFETFLNLNARSPEFLSLYVDDKLRKGLKGASEEETESVLDRAASLFRFLQEKDVFERYYKQHLSKRLLFGRSASDDAEKAFIVRLKTECGYQYTSKIEGMFNDMRVSRDAMRLFRKHLASMQKTADRRNGDDATLLGRETTNASSDGDGQNTVKTPSSLEASAKHERVPDFIPDAYDGASGGIDLNVQVLTTGSWPVPTGAAPCALPPALAAARDAYRDFYLAHHSGRKLSWLTSMGTAEVRGVFAGGTKAHDLIVSTHQMCVLLLFNDADALTFSEIAEATRVPRDELRRSLQSLSLVKGRNVLRKDPPTKRVEESDTFHFNDAFSSKLMRVKIGTVSAGKESEPAAEKTRARVDDDRKPQIEAAIVRVMKARRALDHNGVVQEVTKQLSARFIPDPTDIKKHLENLIEREFIERDRNDRRLFVYLA
jgi:cullin 3